MAAAQSTNPSVPLHNQPRPPAVLLGPGGDHVRPWPCRDGERLAANVAREAAAAAYRRRVAQRRAIEADQRDTWRIKLLVAGQSALIVVLGALLIVSLAGKGGAL